MGAMLNFEITARHVDDWAGTYQARFQLPRLILQLILDTASGIRHIDFPSEGRIAVKVINHLGDEVMKVFRVE